MENEDRQPTERSRPPMATMVTIAIVVVLLIALGLYFMGRDDTPEPPPAMEPTYSAAPAEADPTPPSEPVAEAESATEPAPELAPEPDEPLPPLDQSDQAARDSAGEIMNNDELVGLLVEDDLIRKFVRAVDSADEGRVVHEYRPVLSPRPPLMVERMGEAATDAEQQYRMTSENYQRYDRYVELLTSADAATLAAWYQRYLPLMEEAFVEHGTDKGSFHEVVMTTIDELLEAPAADPEAILVRPKVFYEFQDEELESMPDTHKLMQRIGPEHSERVRAALSSLRGELQRIAP